MTRSFLQAALGLIVVTSLAGCTDGVDTPTTLQPDAVSLDQANAPPSSGPYVIRYEGIATFLIVDPVTGVGAYFGGDIVALCSGDLTAFDPVLIRDLDIPADVNRINEMVQGRDVRVSLWDPAPVTCADVLAMPPVATGTGDLISTDNDLNTFLDPENPNSNAFGVQGHATLFTAAGEKLGLNAFSRCVWDGNDETTIRCKDKVMVH